MSPTSLVAYLVLFAGVGFVFVFVALGLGWVLRPKHSVPAKSETYECGEPSVGSSYVQFDLRFYVVALVFIVFDVEVAFFFPWAAVFGKTTQLMAPSVTQAVRVELPGGGSTVAPSPAVRRKLAELGVAHPTVPNREAGVQANASEMSGTMRRLAMTEMADIAVFFVVLMVGFAYVWSRGDLDWVRAVGQRRAEPSPGLKTLAGVAAGEPR
jgi:NADH-quinone oxidoreductase subunit A